MPELPEVESVRRGLAGLVVGARVESVRIVHPRLVRRQPEGPAAFAGLLRGARLLAPRRRGKFLWLPLERDPVAGPGVGPDALVVHLGMSGQVRVVEREDPVHPHTRVVARLDDGRDLRFVDMRMFGRLEVDELLPTPDVPDDSVPALALHIGRDPLDPHFDEVVWADRLRRRRTGLKRALLDQTLASGIGNIYADEALWRSRLHWARPTETLPRAAALELLGHVRDVMAASMASGGTSFDALYVDVNGESGYYDRALSAYGREGLPCPRCGTAVVREAWTNRSSFRCPACQPRPRRARV
ncbi:bifunctional DNA-formamidopyrimidine glycosylase/DNA-(apurinic or apyrimidinic site) lyase [Jannaschia sp. R86511]|uniref:bifunctional DNA-formamidopyrimidine glycosylase/DNA-(apurinic or apyrimidinic site) lyase n=1 Tax=Jannaschia sp. R86511 TaxID=3093853 RepID=UPI0036D3BAD7